jgi:hypothetical protein
MSDLSLLVSCCASLCVFRIAYAVLIRCKVGDAMCVSRLVSSLHAGALIALGLQWVGSLADLAGWVHRARAVPIGYLLHDIHLCLTEPTLWSKTNLAHHTVFLPMVYYGAAAHPHHTAHSFFAEVTVFPLFLGQTMLRTGASARQPWLFKSNLAALLAVFLRFRVYTFTRFALDALVALGPSSPFTAMMGSFAMLNWYWFGVICIRVVWALQGRPAEQVAARR